jgi:hypothetical protein
MRNLNWALTLSALMAAGLFVSLLGAMLFIPKSTVYSVQARFHSLPSDDHELRLWLQDQPGIVPHTVHSARRIEKTVEVSFIQVRNGLGQPPFPKLEAKAKELGYRGSAEFRDVER